MSNQITWFVVDLSGLIQSKLNESTFLNMVFYCIWLEQKDKLKGKEEEMYVFWFVAKYDEIIKMEIYQETICKTTTKIVPLP